MKDYIFRVYLIPQEYKFTANNKIDAQKKAKNLLNNFYPNRKEMCKTELKELL